MAKLLIEGLYKRFGAVRAIDGVTLDVEDGEFITLLGPSGCGKTTTLNCLAGLETPDQGTIRVGDKVFFDSGRSIDLPPESRNAGLVFQSYALWPHKTVAANIDLPLRLRKYTEQEIRQRVEKIMQVVELSGLEKRYPHELSGGQQQRVALARALVYEPSILLLDEPLSNLDAKLRERARFWLRQIQQRIGTTTVYVTHDQLESLALSDRIAVMKDGKILQIGRPTEIFRNPSVPFVADFMGTNNFFEGTIQSAQGDRMVLRLNNGREIFVPAIADAAPGKKASMAIRPQNIQLIANPEGHSKDPNVFAVKIVGGQYLGTYYEYIVNDADKDFLFHAHKEIHGDHATIHFDPAECSVFLSQ
jgi:iron(III) transport system ATP-binding protein